MPRKLSYRKKLITSLSEAGLRDFKSPKERELAHELLNALIRNDDEQPQEKIPFDKEVIAK